MRPARDRVANRQKRTAAFRPPLNLRRACWRSPRAAGGRSPSGAFFGQKVRFLKRKSVGAEEGGGGARPQGVVPLLSEGRLSRAALIPFRAIPHWEDAAGPSSAYVLVRSLLRHVCGV